MNQRIAIAGALCMQPLLLLADEPTSALDVSVQKRVLDQMSAMVRKEGTSLIFITHDLAVAADRADRIIVLKNGQIVEEGKAEKIFLVPEHPYTRLLMSASTFSSSPAVQSDTLTGEKRPGKPRRPYCRSIISAKRFTAAEGATLSRSTT